MNRSIQLQQRELELLSGLGELGVLNTELIHRRYYPTVTRRRCQQRLRPLHDHGLIRSVALTVWYSNSHAGRVPTIHCLTERGAEAVETITGERPRRAMRSEPTPATIFHRLAVVEARLAIDDACRMSGWAAPAWLMEQDTRSDAETDTPPSRRRVLYHEFTSPSGKTFTCQPDAACLLHIPHRMNGEPAKTTPLLTYWEVDLSTERTLQAASKCPGYAALLEQRSYAAYWPQASAAVVRVFWVCRSQKRIESLAAAVRNKPAARAFRFTTAGELRAETAITEPIWQTVDGERRSILTLPHFNATPQFELLGHPAPHLQPHVGP